MQESDNILKIFKEAQQAIRKQDNLKLKDLSNQTIHTASIAQDPDNILVAVIVYSLSKIIERAKYQTYPGWKKFYKSIESLIGNSVYYLEKKDELKFRETLESLRKQINHLSGKLKEYIQEVFRKASINKASRIYEHGISMEKTAKLLGITLWELSSYAGQTGISDVPLSKTRDVKSRIKLAMDFFTK